MAKFSNTNEVEMPKLTDNELKSLLANANEEELMRALGYHKKDNHGKKNDARFMNYNNFH